jgi:hypothetical protein
MPTSPISTIAFPSAPRSSCGRSRNFKATAFGSAVRFSRSSFEGCITCGHFEPVF